MSRAPHDIRRTIGPAPARLMWTGDDPSDAGHRGALLFLHGFAVDIGVQTPELVDVARAGYLAVGLDAVGHGARRWADFEQRFDRDPADRTRLMFEIIKQTVEEIPAVLDALIASNLAAPARVGIAGISMGGHIAYGARVVDDRLSVVLPILASPTWPEHVDMSPHRSPERFPPAALLSQTAADDEAVPAEEAAAFTNRLAPLYAAHPERLRHVEHRGERHQMTESAWRELWSHVMGWLAAHWPI